MIKKQKTIYPADLYQREFHNDIFVDKYEWLRGKDSERVKDYLNSANSEFDKWKIDNSSLINELFDDIKSRTKEDDQTIPQRIRNYWYFNKTEIGKNYAVMYRFPIRDDDDWVPQIVNQELIDNSEVVFDMNLEAEKFKNRTGSDFFTLGSSDISKDGNFLLFSVDTTGDERYDVYIKNLQTCEIIDQEVTNICAGSEFISKDEETMYFLYTKPDLAWRSFQVWRHLIGSKQSDDVLLFEEKDDRFNLGFGTSEDDSYLFVVSSSKTSDEWQFCQIQTACSVNFSGSDLKIFKKRRENVEYSVSTGIYNDQRFWFVVHNKNSINFDIDYSSDMVNFKRFYSSSENEKINGVTLYKNYIILSTRKNCLVRTYFYCDIFSQPIELVPENLEMFSFSAGASDYLSPVIQYSYQSWITPGKTYVWDLRLNQDFGVSDILLKKREILPSSLSEQKGHIFNSADYEEKRIWFEARDGVKVPLSLIRKKDISGQVIPKPTILYSYGAYGISIDPYFSIPRLSLLDKGVTYVIAHVRGGGELGRKWYESGKLLNKKNSFYDFIDAAKFLIESNISDKNRIAVNGGSAGGLLVGAAFSEEPDLFTAIEADVPFVDPLTTILKPELPLTIPEWEEWGNPIELQQVYEYMKSYSPYENVPDNSKTKILITTSLNDTRVFYVEPAKWFAKLREYGNNVLMKIEMVAGHAGGSGRYKAWENIAEENAWLLKNIGVVK
ncbi:MAG: prolyl oligopeptidase family serine peptidase [Candidatus Ancillula sp.]|jgi:oligopeptidase B|nr:prolyl oligopeptidase family serine peptidase [Candidatus Ancillula sp.]